MHVLWVWRYLGIDGGSRVLLDFAENHDRSTVRLTVGLLEGAHPEVIRRVPPDVSVHLGRRPVRRWLRGPLRKLVWKFYVPGQIGRWVSKLRVDCLLCDGRRELYAACLLKLIGLLSVPLVGRVGSVLSWYLANQRVVPFEPHLAPALLRMPDLIVTPSELASRDLARVAHRPAGTVRTTGNMVSCEGVRKRSAEGPPPIPPPYFLVLGGLTARKDPLTPLRAYSALAHEAGREPGSVPGLLYVGDGPLEGEIRREAERLGVADRVTLAGRLLNPFPALAGATALIHSSHMDGFSFAVAEAMCLRRAVFYAAGAIGLETVLRRYGIGASFPPGDAGSLSVLLRRLLSGAEADGRAGYDGAIREFDPARFRQGYEDAFRFVRRI
jgi:glycosyltransferase involved in cell wall biosynthesis